MSPKSRVLVVDDNVDFADGLSWVIEELGYPVAACYTAEQTLERGDLGDFDVVLLDFKLPKKTGFAARREVKARNPRARIFAMSGLGVDHLMAATFGSESTRVLRHPFSSPTLSQVLAQVGPGGLVLTTGEEPVDAVPEQVADLERKIQRIGSPDSADTIASDCDLLLLNLGLPVIDALDVYSELLESDRQRLSEVQVLVHATLDAADRKASDLLQCPRSTGLFVKPFELEEVFQVLS